MRDAFGGAFMIKLFLVFLAIYIGFTAMALNYAKAFKVKNKVVDYLENNEIVDMRHMSAADLNKMEADFETEILGNMNYRVDTSKMNCRDTVYCQNGIIIRQINPHMENRNKIGVYYKVETYVGWSIPFLNKLLALNGSETDATTAIGHWRVAGETRPIVYEKTK